MTQHETTTRGWRAFWLLPVMLLAALSIVASGGGGGGDGDGNGGGSDDGGDGGGDGPVTILTTYNMILTNLPGDNLLTADVGGAFSVALDFDSLYFTTLNLDVASDNAVTFLSYTAQQSNRFDLIVTGDAQSPLLGTLTVTLTEDIDANVDEAPTSGAFTVTTPGETVSVDIDSSGVQIGLNGGVPVAYTWGAFEDLLEDDTAELWQRRASLGANAFTFIYDLFFEVADALDELEAVTLNNPVVTACDMFPGSPPAGVIAQGETSITWLGSGELMDGDDFEWTFTQCWTDDPFDDTDGLLDGSISLQDYTETVDTDSNTLFEIGFGSLGDGPGGVVFDLAVSETEEDNGVFTIAPEDVIVVAGGFVMIIQQF